MIEQTTCCQMTNKKKREVNYNIKSWTGQIQQNFALYYQTFQQITLNNFTTMYRAFILLFISQNMNRTMRAYSLKTLPKHPPFRSTSQNFSKRKNVTESSSLLKTLTIGDYNVKCEDLMGTGSSSKVYKGTNTKTGEEVALKIIDLQKLSSIVQKRFLRNEIQSLKKLKQANNIIQVHQIIESKTQVIIITQLCHQTLQNIMKKGSNKKIPLQFSIATKIFQEILIGYLQMRQRGLVHRDIKPANIFMSFDGCAKLGDLGFSVSDQKLQEDSFIKAGSPLYMAPQILKSNQYSSKADIWSLGIVLLEMMIGSLPWASCEEKLLHKLIMSCDFDDLIPNFVDQKWRQVILRCVQLNPKSRWGALELMKFINPEFQLSQLSYCQEGNKQKQSEKVRHRNYTQMYVQETDISKEFLRSNNTTEYSRPKAIPKSSLGAAKTNTFQLYSKGQKLVNQKLIQNQILNEMNKQKKVQKQLKSKLNLARISFRLIQTLQKDKDNIHVNCINLEQQFEQVLAHFILDIFDQIKEVKSCFSLTEVQHFKKSFEFRFLKQMAQKYEKNYKSYFALKHFFDVSQTKSCQTDQLVQGLKRYLLNSKNHLTIIYQEMLNSGLPQIYDEEICGFFKVVDFLSIIYRSLRLMKRNCEIFVNMNKLQEIVKKKEQDSYTLVEIQDILSKLFQ